MQFYYENELGVLRFDGGNGLWNVTNYSGLSLAEKSFATISYAKVPGQITLHEKTAERHITLRGDCSACGDELSRGMRILNRKGWLTVISGEKIRKIQVYCSHFEMDKNRGSFKEFIVQFTADDPYFLGKETMTKALYSREDLVASRFTLPCVFTKREMECVIENRGDVETEPILTIVCNRAGTGQDKSVLIENVTTGSFLRLNYALAEGEIVTVDVPGRKVYSNYVTEGNNEGNLIFCLSGDTVLKNMILVPGDNRFLTRNFCMGSDIMVGSKFEEKYIEAVV